MKTEGLEITDAIAGADALHRLSRMLKGVDVVARVLSDSTALLSLQQELKTATTERRAELARLDADLQHAKQTKAEAVAAAQAAADKKAAIEAEAQGLLAEASAQAEQILGQARAQAEDIVGDAKRRASAINRDAAALMQAAEAAQREADRKTEELNARVQAILGKLA